MTEKEVCLSVFHFLCLCLSVSVCVSVCPYLHSPSVAHTAARTKPLASASPHGAAAAPAAAATACNRRWSISSRRLNAINDAGGLAATDHSLRISHQRSSPPSILCTYRLASLIRDNGLGVFCPSRHRSAIAYLPPAHGF